MSSSASVWLVIAIALIAANLPFASNRIFILGPKLQPKPLAWRLVEWLVLWALTLGIGVAIEGRLGQVQRQGWEFYAAFGFLFATLAFPGFVWRCLRRGP